MSPALASRFFTTSASWIQGFKEPLICWRERTSDLPADACGSELKGRLGVFAHPRLTCPLVSPLYLSPLSWATNCPARPQGLHTVSALEKLMEHTVNQCSHFSCLETWLLLTSLGRCPCFCCFIKDFICDRMTDSSFRKREELVWTIVKLRFNSKKTGLWQLQKGQSRNSCLGNRRNYLEWLHGFRVAPNSI